MTTIQLKCEICGGVASGVASSALGAISHAYCNECLRANREVWTTLVGGLSGIRRGEEALWVKPIIQATLAFYGKTEEELWAEADVNWKDYCAAMRVMSDG